MAEWCNGSTTDFGSVSFGSNPSSASMKNIKIRYNTNFPIKSKFEWRVLVDGVENLVNSVIIESPTYSSSDFIEGHGLKHHIQTNASFFEIVNSGDKLVAYIK